MADANVSTRTAEIQPRKRPALSEEQHRRRNLLGAIAAAPLAAAVPATAAAGEDPHVGWGAEQQALLAYIRGPGRDDMRDLEDTAHGSRMYELEELILDSVATFPAGMREQVRVIAQYMLDGSDNVTIEDRGIRNLLAGLDHLCSGSA